jgi:hypothetical protein
MWTIDFVKEMIATKQEQISDKEAFIREADFSRDLTDCVKSRAVLLERLTKLEEIREEMEKCSATNTMNDYISQKALVYTLIQAYKA